MHNILALFPRTILLLFLPVSIWAQSGDWVADSLDFYREEMEKAILKQDTAVLVWIQSHVYVRGTKSLDTKIYDQLYNWEEDEKIRQYPIVQAKLLHNLGNLEFYRSRMGSAKANFAQALEKYSEAGARGDAAGMAMNLGIISERSGEYDSAIYSYERAMPIFLEIGDTAAIAVCLENIGLAYRYKGEVRRALEYLQRTDSLLSLNTPAESIRWSYLFYNFSQIYAMLGDYEQALDYAYNGLRISELNGDERQTNIGYVELQNLYDQVGDDRNWLKYIRKALVFARRTENGMRIADLEFSLASYYADQKILDSAAFYADSGLAYYQDNDIVEGRGRGLLIKGRIAYERNDYNAAIASFNQALASFSPSSVEISRAYQSLGAAYMETGDYDRANQHLLKALDLRLQTEELKLITNTYKTLAENNDRAGNHQQAYQYLSTFMIYNDSLFNENKSKQIALIEAEYETEKKDQAIMTLEQEREIQALIADKRQNQMYLASGGLGVLLLAAGFFYYRARTRRKANRMLQEKNEKIERQNKEKETLLKEIHHRVKNNLQVISSLLSMQSRSMTDQLAIDAMQESQGRVKTMALIHEKLYQYDDLSRINMREYMTQLSDFLSQTYRADKEIRVVIEADNIDLDIDTAVPVGLITNELLSNAWKYAFHEMENGEINVQLHADRPGFYRLQVRDNGRGIPRELDLENHRSLGLKLVRSLTRQLQGRFDITPETKGTSFTVEFRDISLVA